MDPVKRPTAKELLEHPYSKGRKCIVNLVMYHFIDLKRYLRGCTSDEEEDDVDVYDMNNNNSNVHYSQIFSKRNTSEHNVIINSRYESINDDNLKSSVIIIHTQPQNESCNNDSNNIDEPEFKKYINNGKIIIDDYDYYFKHIIPNIEHNNTNIKYFS